MNYIELKDEALEYLAEQHTLDEMRYGLDGSIAIDLEDVLGEELDYDICINTYAEENDVFFEFDHTGIEKLLDEKQKEIETVTQSKRDKRNNFFYIIQDGVPVVEEQEADKIYDCVDELINADIKYDEARNKADRTIEELLKKTTGLDIEVGTFLEEQEAYFEIQNMTIDEISKIQQQVEQATKTIRKYNYSFYFI